MGKMERSLVLPFELEREILELAARAFPGFAVTLSTLCKYVQEWMEALIYETVVVELPFETKRLFLRTFHERPASFFTSHVKRLYILNSMSYQEAQDLLSACTGVIDVACWASQDLFNGKENLIDILPTKRLQRLSIKLDALWGAGAVNANFSVQLFPNLSHLEIVNPPPFECLFSHHLDDLGGLCSLPSLTHLAFGDLWESEHLYLIPFFEDVLKRCPRLEVLILETRDTYFRNALFEIKNDPRTVVQKSFNGNVPQSEYWEAIRQGGLDMWSRAEKVVSMRRSLVEGNGMLA
ncbi:hypothetical protein M413DRAFT_442235 [Hebeloma cylindrosporum]|uniref:F-box domain-containing protein n=1 Tax=Hebeloma cylindrosporum TaxID=76867 RepID=A0A0C2Y6U8_HEBCY|nr:hypothetical protein M413DRAFT_442235 [Hebeloma cylindrosporum h7]